LEEDMKWVAWVKLDLIVPFLIFSKLEVLSYQDSHLKECEVNSVLWQWVQVVWSLVHLQKVLAVEWYPNKEYPILISSNNLFQDIHHMTHCL
jgi:hypothetical protein